MTSSPDLKYQAREVHDGRNPHGTIREATAQLAIGISVVIVILGFWAPLIGGGASEKPRFATDDGFTRAEVGLLGRLRLRANHGVDRYDALIIPPATVDYQR